MKVAHFSDIHLGIDDDDHYRIKWLLQDAIDRGAEHIVIAGDTVDHGNLDDFRIFCRTLKELGRWSPKKLTIVPGNHDIIGGSLDHWTGIATDSEKKRDRRLTSLGRSIAPLVTGSRRGPNRSFAHLKRLGDVAIIALDTTDPEGFIPGAVGDEQMEDLAALLAVAAQDGLFPVVVGHHRPIDVDPGETSTGYQFAAKLGEHMDLWDGEELIDTIKDGGGRLYLCGHWHVLGDEHYVNERGVRVWTQGISGGVADDAGDVWYGYDLVTIEGTKVRRTEVVHDIDDIDGEVFGDDDDADDGDDDDDPGVLERIKSVLG